MLIKLILPATVAAFLAGCASPSAHTQIQTAQERSACAEMGLDPGSQYFANCVAGLDATIVQYNSQAYR